MTTEESAGDRDRRLIRWLWVPAIGLALILGAANLVFGEINQDEGWYLYAARLVAAGKLPYVDFASTQGPVMPFVYVLSLPAVERWGIAGGRLFTFFLGLGAALAAGGVAASLAPRDRRGLAAFLAFVLAAVNVYQSYFCVVVKTYALTGLFLTLGFLVLARWRTMAGAFLAGILMALAAGTRTSAVMALPVCLMGLAWAWREAGGWGRAAGYAGGAALALAALFVPFALKAPQGLWFALYEYHTAREAGSVLATLAYKAGFLSRVVQDYFVPLALLAALGIHAAFGRRFAPVAERSADAERLLRRRLAAMVLGTVGLISAVHFMAPFPYDDYQVMIFPLLAAGVGAALACARDGAEAAGSGMRQGAAAATVLVLCAASAFSSPLNQAWFVGQRDRLWWPLKSRSAVGQFRDLGRQLRDACGKDGLLLTQDVYVAVEAGLRVPEGLELGPFSYFPDWPTEKAEKIHVLNRDLLVRLLETCEAPMAAVSGYGFAVESPRVTALADDERARWLALLETRYEPIDVVERFGHAATSMTIYRKKQGRGSTGGDR